jgi:hypothetical protein
MQLGGLRRCGASVSVEAVKQTDRHTAYRKAKRVMYEGVVRHYYIELAS